MQVVSSSYSSFILAIFMPAIEKSFKNRTRTLKQKNYYMSDFELKLLKRVRKELKVLRHVRCQILNQVFCNVSDFE